jgi:diaminohydroxyphosphoribosylaminopyrimidine deaminase/5-amino-6-(5-phosphoribosylamino)uracil reductase
MTLDGKIATATGDSRWISNEASRRRVHEMRGRMDAIIIGLGTALADDPLLTARPPGPRTAVRIVLDSHGQLPETCQLVRTARDVPTLLATVDPPSAHAQGALRECGCEVLGLSSDSGRPSVTALLDVLGQRRMTNVLVEGGAGVLGAFFDADQVDEVHIFVAPKIVGGSGAKSPVGGRGVERIAQALALTELTAENIDSDVYLHGRRRER